MPDISEPAESDSTSSYAAKRRSLSYRLIRWVSMLLVAYLVIAYLLVPIIWHRYIHRHPALDDVPGITETKMGIPGDPINVALVGTKEDVEKIFHTAQWYAADRLGLRSDLKIATDTVFDRSYDDAPVSSLFLFGRKEDLAFEKPVGDNPRKRNHVRFWKSEKIDSDGRPFWLGSATYDERVGFSHTTGEITHHIGSDVDVERDRLMDDLQKTGDLQETYAENGFHKVLEGRNGGGDRWYTDGRLLVGVIRASGTDTSQASP
jgi:hypothetical protein